MESPRKFNDCYFYYYSTCTKGDNCVFRHEPSALGCETMCTAWQQGKCTDKRCKLRHMELRKNRKQIPCYWETQPGGCRKKHCPFMHKNPDARTDGIAPSQPGPPTAQVQPIPAPMQEAMPIPEQRPLPSNVAPQPAPMSVLWQQQRQILDSALMGVLPPTSAEILSRRVMAHEQAPNPYAPLAVDPLVVNFEEESDNESAPSSTPTKSAPVDDAQRIARTKSQEILLLERIQAEAAAFYNYDNLPPAVDPPKERKILRVNLNNKYEKLSLDEIAGKKQTERRKSLDFKVLSLDEIRARKKTTETTEIVQTAPITINLSCRKRKTSTTKTLTASGNKLLKVVRSNSIVYKKLDKNAPAQPSQSKPDLGKVESRKRTLSEQSALIYDMQEDELVDNCYEFKRIKFNDQQSTKPLIIRNRHLNANNSDAARDLDISDKADNDSDSEVQIVSVDSADSSKVDIIDLDSKLSDVEDVVDLSEDVEESEINDSDVELELIKNVPDVVASCQKIGTKSDDEVLSDVDEDTLLKDDDNDLYNRLVGYRDIMLEK